MTDVVRAGPGDLERLIALMTEFYADADFTLNPGRAAAAFRPLLDGDDLGSVWLLRAEGTAVGRKASVTTLDWQQSAVGATCIRHAAKPTWECRR